MRSNIKLGRISGIEIGLHYSWFIIAALISILAWRTLPSGKPDLEYRPDLDSCAGHCCPVLRHSAVA